MDVTAEWKAAKAKASNLRVHFKNTCETANAIQGMRLGKAVAYLKRVLAHKDCIPFRRFHGHVGRTAQAKNHKAANSQGRWPRKSVEFVLDLLRNARANATHKDLDVKNLRISYVHANAAPKIRRRMYRAHGRVNPFMGNPTHMHVILTEDEVHVPTPAELARTQKRKEALKAKKAAGKAAKKAVAPAQ